MKGKLLCVLTSREGAPAQSPVVSRTCWWHRDQVRKPPEGEAQGFPHMLASAAWSIGIPPLQCMRWFCMPVVQDLTVPGKQP